MTADSLAGQLAALSAHGTLTLPQSALGPDIARLFSTSLPSASLTLALQPASASSLTRTGTVACPPLPKPAVARALVESRRFTIAVPGRLPLDNLHFSLVDVPVIASGGVGTLEHLADGIEQGGADAVLAASIFHYGQHTVGEAKALMASRGIPVRP